MENKVIVPDSDEECTLKDVPSKIVLIHSTTTNTHTHMVTPSGRLLVQSTMNPFPGGHVPSDRQTRLALSSKVWPGCWWIALRDAVCAACSSGKCLLFTRTLAAKTFEIAQQFETPKWEGKMD